MPGEATPEKRGGAKTYQASASPGALNPGFSPRDHKPQGQDRADVESKDRGQLLVG
jgi:hypothetical protein